MILSGDLNSAPNSGVYKLITEGSLDCNKIDRKKVRQFFNLQISGQELGNLNYLNPKKLKSNLISQSTKKFNEAKVPLKIVIH